MQTPGLCGRFCLHAIRLARFGGLAPSCHNTQPWKFSFHRLAIQIHPDTSRRLPVIDPQDRAVSLSLGCVAENILIAAEHHGFSAELEPFGSRTDGSVMIHLTPAMYKSSTAELVAGMALRQCNRRPFNAESISKRDLEKLSAAARQPGVEFGLITGADDIRRVADWVRTSKKDEARTENVAAELAKWTRFSRREAEFKRDGLLFTEMGYPPMPRCIGRRLVAGLVRSNRQRERSDSFVRSSSALMVFAPHRDEKTHWFDVGRSFQRVTLTAASLRIRYAHLQLPYSPPLNPEDLGKLSGCGTGQPVLAARIGYSHAVPRSLRRPLWHMLTAESCA